MRAAIIGGGAAGLFAACRLSRAGAEVVLLEKQSRVGRKLLSTGNGRCNLSNLNASPADYHGDAKYIEAALRTLSPEGAMARFASMGVLCAPDNEGRVYPISGQAAGVLDALRLCAAESGCEIVTEFEAAKLNRKNNRYIIASADGRTVEADFVLVTCGGLAAPKLGGCGDGYKLLEHFGHQIAPRFPAIAAIKTDPAAVRALKGIRMRGEIALVCGGRELRREAGEILFGEGAVSGIAAMQLARALNLERRECELRLNFLPNVESDFIDRRAAQLPKRAMEDFLSGIVPKRLGQVLVRAAGIEKLSLTAAELTPHQRRAIYRALTGWTLPARGTLGFDQAQVTCGGAKLDGFDPNTLESRFAPGLFAAGEVLDVDGDCGGFNLHWAWASAELACAEILRRMGRIER